MQVIKSLLLTSVLMITCAWQVQAKGPESPDEQLRARVSNLVARADGHKLRQKERDATLEFIITPNNKIVVTEVHTDSDYLEQFIKETLNYQTLKIKGLRKLTPYILNVTFVKGS